MEKFNSPALKAALDKAVTETTYQLKSTSPASFQGVTSLMATKFDSSVLNEQFVPFTESHALRMLGFDEPCFGAWMNNTQIPSKGHYPEQIEVLLDGGCLAPLWQQAFKFFLDKFELSNSRREHYTKESGRMSYWYSIKFLKTEEKIKGVSMVYDTFEQARLECLRRLIDIAKNGYEDLFCSKV